MNEVTKTTVAAPNVEQTKILKSGFPVMEVQLKRDCDGVKLTLKSQVDWSFLHRKGTETLFAGVKCSQPQAGNINGVRGDILMSNTPAECFMVDNRPNLAVLLAKDMKGGVTFNFGLFPVSDQAMKDWLSNFKEQIKAIYLNYMKPISLSAVFTSQVIETQQND